MLFISDTHGQHHNLNLPPTDILIHAGDISKRGGLNEVLDFLDWFVQQEATHKIFIAGNHDFFFERASEAEVKAILPGSITYLHNSGVEINGLKIWGSPITPWFYDWAFNRQRGVDINKYWQRIPDDIDMLITHGPPFGIMDRTHRNEEVGCEDLLRKVQEIQPKLHVFGHIHEGYGVKQLDGTTYINASVLDVKYNQVNQPIEWGTQESKK